MEVFTEPAAMRDWSRAQRTAERRVAVVPTMGALHEGHRALIRAARDRADLVIVTIFVNPLQFNQAADFDAYPRPIDDDLDACSAAGVDAVYAPTAATMYPAGFQTHVEPGDLADRIEGPMRPGHFRGVTTVVTKLFGATEPDVAMFGRKDYQQLAIVRRMVADLDRGVEIVGIPIVRETDGLALSSRNVRLTADDRAAAVVLVRALGAGRKRYDDGDHDADSIRDVVTAAVEAEPRAALEYVEVVDAVTLAPLDRLDRPAVVLTAAWFGDVRLIDNVALGDG
jgi:pantoate--beta-alanine ligase